MTGDPTTSWWLTLSDEDKRAATEDYNERAAIMEYLGEMSRPEAERRAGELIRKRYGAER